MSNYEDFIGYYEQLTDKFQNLLFQFITKMDHDFERQDGNLAKGLKQALEMENAKNMRMAKKEEERTGKKTPPQKVTIEQIAERAHVNVDTLKKNMSRKSKEFRDSDMLAEALGISVYQLYFGEDEKIYQSRTVCDIKHSFESQSLQNQKALIFLAHQLFVLDTIPELSELDLNEDADWREPSNLFPPKKTGH